MINVSKQNAIEDTVQLTPEKMAISILARQRTSKQRVFEDYLFLRFTLINAGEKDILSQIFVLPLPPPLNLNAGIHRLFGGALVSYLKSTN